MELVLGKIRILFQALYLADYRYTISYMFYSEGYPIMERYLIYIHLQSSMCILIPSLSTWYACIYADIILIIAREQM